MTDKGPLERVLAPIADVRRGEAAGALVLTLLMFLTLAGYYMLKTAREVFILSEGGAEVKSYASAGQAILLLVLVPAYGAFASRVNRVQLVSWVTLFFASHIVIFGLAARAGFSVGVPFFLWLGIFNSMVIAQFWAFANDLYTREQGTRLFPLIGVGSSLGAWLGSLRAGTLMDTVGPLRLLASGTALLLICVALVRVADRVTQKAKSGPSTGSGPGPVVQAPPSDERVGGGQSGFGMLLSDRYLGLIGLLVLLLNVVNTTGEYLFGRYVVESAVAQFGSGDAAEAARGRFIGDAYSQLYANVNLLGFLLQMFVVSRLFKFAGVGGALFVQPVVAGAGYRMMLVAPSFNALRVLKTVENAIDYSVSNTTKQALWLPTSRQAKYKAKQAVDSFCVRAGDVLTAVIVYAGEIAAFAIPAFAALTLALTGGWLAVAAALNRRLRTMSGAAAPAAAESK